MLYLSMVNVVVNEKPGKDPFKKVDKALIDVISKSYSNVYRYCRVLLFTNLLNHLRFGRDEEPSKEMQKFILQGSIKLERGERLMIFSMAPILLEQYARYQLLSENKCPRTFFWLIIKAASMYLKRKISKAFAKACFIVAKKFYDRPEFETWGFMNEFLYYNLGNLYLDQYGRRDLDRALECFLKTMTLYNRFSQVENQRGDERKERYPLRAEEKIKNYGSGSVTSSFNSAFMTSDLNPLQKSTSQPVDLLDVPILSPQEVQPVGGVFIQEEKYRKKIESTMRTLEVKGYKCFEAERYPKKLGGDGRSELQTFDQVYSMKKHFDNIINILDMKMGKEADKLKQKLTQFGSNAPTASSDDFFTREISVGESVEFRLDVKSHYYVSLDILTIRNECIRKSRPLRCSSIVSIQTRATRRYRSVQT